MADDYEYQLWKGDIGPGAVLQESIRLENEERMAKQAAIDAAAAVEIPEDVCKLLGAGEWSRTAADHAALKMPKTTDRKLYLKTAAVLEALGGKWDRKAQATVFADDPDADVAVREAILAGRYVDSKKLYQFFETPRGVADYLVGELKLQPRAEPYTVLEPSAGHGSLVNAVAAACVDGVDVQMTLVELDPAKEQLLKEFVGRPSQIAQRLFIRDFMHFSPQDLGLFDRVIMNPPFCRGQDMQHVQHAYEFLKPGGVLVAVVSPAYTYRTDKATVKFHSWLGKASGNGGRVTSRSLPDGSFKTAGTNVRTVMLVIRKGQG